MPQSGYRGTRFIVIIQVLPHSSKISDCTRHHSALPTPPGFLYSLLSKVAHKCMSVRDLAQVHDLRLIYTSLLVKRMRWAMSCDSWRKRSLIYISGMSRDVVVANCTEFHDTKHCTGTPYCVPARNGQKFKLQRCSPWYLAHRVAKTCEKVELCSTFAKARLRPFAKHLWGRKAITIHHSSLSLRKKLKYKSAFTENAILYGSVRSSYCARNFGRFTTVLRLEGTRTTLKATTLPIAECICAILSLVVKYKHLMMM